MSLLTTLPEELRSTLEDIVGNVQIQSHFCISHPQYAPLKLPDEVAAKLAKLPIATQHKYLRLQLRSFLQGIYYQGNFKTILATDTSSSDRSYSSTLENNHTIGFDTELFYKLHKSNCGEGYFDRGWRVVGEEGKTILFAHKNDLTLKIDRDCYLQPSERFATIGDVIAVKMPRNLVEQGFYIAVGNGGSAYADNECQTVNVYFNLSSEGAVAITKSLTQQLNEREVPFTFKVLYDLDDYGRYDSGILNFERDRYFTIKQILQTIYAENKSFFGKDIPFLTKWLAPGLGLAEEPDNREAPQDSFGKNRYQIFANALLESWQQNNNSPEERIESIVQHFSSVGIDLKLPYLSTNSQDIYIPLD
jgi:hypothetical protein